MLSIKNVFRLNLIVFLFFNLGAIQSQDNSSSMQAWEGLLHKPGLASYFNDVFTNLGIVVDDRNEQFTVHHKGDHFTLSSGIETGTVDYTVRINAENIKNMQKHGQEGEISEEESFEILSVLFTPLTRSSLESPMMSKPLMQKMAGIENHIHVHLTNDTGTKSANHTLIFVNKKWTVIEGIYGDAKRVFTLTPKQALAYQKRVFKANKINSMKEWRSFKRWYKQWRNEVSVKS